MTTNKNIVVRICSTKSYKFIRRDNIEVLEISVKRQPPYNRLDECLKLGIMEVTKIYQYLNRMGVINTVYFFLRTPSIFLPNVIVKRNGIWGHKDFLWISSEKRRTNDIIEIDDNGIYYCGIAELDHFDFFCALNHSRNSSSSALLFTSKTNVKKLLSIFQFKEIFNEKTSRIKWDEFIDLFCTGNNIVLKVHGVFDDDEIFIDLFMDEKLREPLKTILFDFTFWLVILFLFTSLKTSIKQFIF
jgi:hypothetical protein